VKPGTISTATTTLANLMATCSDLVGERSAQFKTGDSFSILPQLTGSELDVAGQKAVVHISSKGVFAIRKGSWKLIMGLGSGGFTVPVEIKPQPGEATGQLYNLTTDIHEDNNLYQQYPEKVKELSALLEIIKNQKTK
jgi:arylsulfatase A-like enzyme